MNTNNQLKDEPANGVKPVLGDVVGFKTNISGTKLSLN